MRGNMIRRRILTAVVVVLIAVVSLFGNGFLGRAYAAQTSEVGGNALKISPVRNDLTMDPGSTLVTDVYITNLTNVSAELSAQAEDFTASSDESGTPQILLNGQDAPSHSLRQFVQPIANFDLPAQGEKDIKVTIVVPQGAAGGGYYGLIRIFPASQTDNGKNVNLAASVGSLILLTVNGNINEQMSMASFDVRRGDNAAFIFTSNKNLVNVARFQNTGNIQLEPFGTMELKRFGKTIKTYEVNTEDPKGNVLPDSIRRFDTSLTGISSFGKFELIGNFGYGSKGQLITASATFYIIPVGYAIAGIIVILLLLVGLFVLPRMIRAYNRRVLRKASRRR